MFALRKFCEQRIAELRAKRDSISTDPIESAHALSDEDALELSGLEILLGMQPAPVEPESLRPGYYWIRQSGPDSPWEPAEYTAAKSRPWWVFAGARGFDQDEIHEVGPRLIPPGFYRRPK